MPRTQNLERVTKCHCATKVAELRLQILFHPGAGVSGRPYSMDVVKAIETYVNWLVSTPPAMKVLLLDSHTVCRFCERHGLMTEFTIQTPIVSLSSTQSTLLSHQVYLTDRIDNKKRDRMPHMKCVCFLQSNEDSLEALEAELKEPKYGEYYLCQSVNHSGHPLFPL